MGILQDKWFNWVKGWFTSKEPVTQQNQSNKDVQVKTSGITVRELRKIITQEYPPFTWEKIGLFLYKDFKKHGLIFTQLKGNEIIPQELLNKISDTLDIFYKKRLSI